MSELSTDSTEWTPVLHVELSGLSAPQQARWLVREHLAGAVSIPFLRDALLATSEVVTNAIRYAPGPCQLSMQRSAGTGHIRIGVADTNPTLPATVDPEDDPLSSGRGLLIVDTVASAWGTNSTANGKEVWFEMVPERRS